MRPNNHYEIADEKEKRLRKLELLKKRICHEKRYLKRCHLVDSHGVWQLKAGYAWLAGIRTHSKAWHKCGSLPPACPSWSFRPLPDAKQTNDAKLAAVLPACFIYFISQNQQLGNKCPLKAELSPGWVIFPHPKQHPLRPHNPLSLVPSAASSLGSPGNSFCRVCSNVSLGIAFGRRDDVLGIVFC